MKDLTNEQLIQIIESQDSWDSDEFRELLDRAKINYYFKEDPADPEELYREALRVLNANN